VSAEVGVLGGGQLGRMLGLAGLPLDLRFVFLDPTSEAPAATVGRHIRAAYDDHRALNELVALSDVVTYEFENVPSGPLRLIEARVKLCPSIEALEIAQDRLVEKQVLERAGVPVAPYEAASSQEELENAVIRVGSPAVVKTRRMGYDGKGQMVVRDGATTAGAFDHLGSVPLIVESLVGFDRELSVIAVRSEDGGVFCYPVIENSHRNGILRLSLAPAPDLDPALDHLAKAYARSLMDGLGYVGVLALELFQVGRDLIANEFAPRVHNSGHWTIEGAEFSQFENHLRAILGLPLGSTEVRGHCAMVNLIGSVPPLRSIASIPEAHIHVYGKRVRPGRKVGHVTVCAPDARGRDRLLETIRASVGRGENSPSSS
jgi:5-(carboxyamino)imidazole ribonucleotide synthase